MLDEHVIAARFAERPEVQAVALAGSRGASRADGESDVDLYVYANEDVAVEFRRSLFPPDAEIDNRFWEPGDEFRDPESGQRFDVMYRRPAWIEDQLDRVLRRHEASIGYSTCFWFNVLHSTPIYDASGWYGALRARARVPYPEELRRAIVAKNLPLLRRNQSSYRRQIELAVSRGDAFSVQHRVTALLASFFDIWFALERQPHPGEKRLLTWLPPEWAGLVRQVIDSPPGDKLPAIDELVERLEQRAAGVA